MIANHNNWQQPLNLKSGITIIIMDRPNYIPIMSQFYLKILQVIQYNS